MNKTLTAPNCLIYIIQQTCFKPHYFNSLIQLYCIHKQVGVHCKKTETDDKMIKKFLLHKDKENGNPPHIQAHLAAPTHGRPLRSQKSLHFANAPLKDSDLFE